MTLQIMIQYLCSLPFKIWFTNSRPNKRDSKIKTWRPEDANLLPITAKKILHS